MKIKLRNCKVTAFHSRNCYNWKPKGRLIICHFSTSKGKKKITRHSVLCTCWNIKLILAPTHQYLSTFFFFGSWCMHFLLGYVHRRVNCISLQQNPWGKKDADIGALAWKKVPLGDATHASWEKCDAGHQLSICLNSDFFSRLFSLF